MVNPNKCRVVILAVLTGSVATFPALAEDDYLSALEAEASDTGNLASKNVVSAGSDAVLQKSHSVADSQAIAQGLDFGGFEEELVTHYPGTWVLYVKLAAAQRRAVYRAYRKNNSTAALREEVVRQLASN